MIKGVHAMFYSSQADELRAFLRDKLGFPFTDVGGGWLLFDVAEVEVGVHPSDEAAAHSRAGMHAISLYCDDIESTMSGLRAKGVAFQGDVSDQGYGLVTQLDLPGGVSIQLYQPKYQNASAPRPVPRRLSSEMLEEAASRAGRAAARRKAPKKKAGKKKVAAKKAGGKKAAKKAGKKKLARRKR